MNKKLERAIVITSLIIIIVLFAFFLREIAVPLVRAQFNRDFDTAKELLKEHGIFGALSIALIEALQMVIIFVSAEFIQISAGLTYPLPVAVILCDAGVCLGATIIFVLVRALRYSSSSYEKRKGKIERLSQGALNTDKSMMTLMYFLFFMPIIPFGAICYRGSYSKLPYGKYILTVATGVIPSILTSILMGNAARLFIMNQIPIGLLILIILLCAAALFALIWIFLEKVLFKHNNGTPDSMVHSALLGIAHILRRHRQKLTLEPGDLEKAEEPYVLMSNHPSFWDFYYIDRLPFKRRPMIVVNEFYTRRPFLRKLAPKCGIIPKKLFSPDIKSVAGIMKALRKGWSVNVFPEGRMSIDGTTYPFPAGTGGFFRKMGKDLVLVNISGAYTSKPKWRDRFFRSDITVSVKRVIKSDELASMSPEEVEAAIKESISSTGGDLPPKPYRRKDLARGIEKVLFRCPDCGALYSLTGKGVTISCSACGSSHVFDGYYRLEDGRTVADCYAAAKEIERRELASTVLETRVCTKVFLPDGKTRKETGVCRMDRENFVYEPDGGEPFTIPLEQTEALAFSCGEEFELYNDEDLYYFYPVENRLQTVRWGLLADLVREERDGRSCEDPAE
ncbi:MAG: VTT domain-containing protein [Clostridia bacterium]|nr:VTT domain-containing protein [Clostridia bacterium]